MMFEKEINPNGQGVSFDEMIKRIEKLFIYKRVLCHARRKNKGI